MDTNYSSHGVPDGPAAVRIDTGRLDRCIGLSIRLRREAEGKSQRVFAPLCGLSRSGLAQIESGRGGVSTGSLQRICAVLGISLTELMAEAERRMKG